MRFGDTRRSGATSFSLLASRPVSGEQTFLGLTSILSDGMLCLRVWKCSSFIWKGKTNLRINSGSLFSLNQDICVCPVRVSKHYYRRAEMVRAERQRRCAKLAWHPWSYITNLILQHLWLSAHGLEDPGPVSCLSWIEDRIMGLRHFSLNFWKLMDPRKMTVTLSVLCQPEPTRLHWKVLNLWPHTWSWSKPLGQNKRRRVRIGYLRRRGDDGGGREITECEE